ncbi:unnamed protein product, partial [marine sediment metagenome]
MNLIKPKIFAKHVRKVFMKEVIPVSTLSNKREQAFFPLGPDPYSLTYYREREQTAMTPEDFEV